MSTTGQTDLAAWRQRLGKSLQKAPLRRATFATDADIPLDDLYDPREHPLDEAALGLPGEYPYTRGVQATMYRGRFWTMR